MSACPRGNALLTGDFSKSGPGAFGTDVQTYVELSLGPQANWRHRTAETRIGEKARNSAIAAPEALVRG